MPTSRLSGQKTKGFPPGLTAKGARPSPVGQFLFRQDTPGWDDWRCDETGLYAYKVALVCLIHCSITSSTEELDEFSPREEWLALQVILGGSRVWLYELRICNYVAPKLSN